MRAAIIVIDQFFRYIRLTIQTIIQTIDLRLEKPSGKV